MYITLRNGLKMSECILDNGFSTNNLLGTPRNDYGNLSKKKQTKIDKEKLVILQSIGIIVIKSKETRVIAYTCRYSKGHLIPIIQLCQDELGIKCTRISAGVDDHLCFLTFITMIPIDCKIINFSLY